MAEPTPEQQKQIADAIASAQAKLKADNRVQVIISGAGSWTSENPHFQIEQRKE